MTDSGVSGGTLPLPEVSEAEAQLLDLRDGRRLGFGEWGDLDGVPAFFFHGTPGSRILTRAFKEPAEAKGVRLIGVDRPGYGLSEPKEDRTVMNFATDVGELADFLQLDRFGVMGASGGSPYVLACAHRFPERIFGALVICGVGPPESWDDVAREILEQTVSNPSLGEASLKQFADAARDDRASLTQTLLQSVPEFARSVAESKPELLDAFIDHHLEGQRQGSRGTIVEQQLVLEPWGFALEEIQVPVRVWCGGKDQLLPQARWMAERLTGSKLRVDEEAGHIDGLWIAPDLIDMLLDCLTSEGSH